MATESPRGISLHLDMEKMNEMLKTQPRFTVTTTLDGRQATLIEAIRAKPGIEAADNQVNVLC